MSEMINQQPLISVIMGVYNCETTVASAIESIMAQTYTNWKFIICDDGSKDSTLNIVKTYANTDKRIVVIKNEKNMRLAYTLNHCLKYAEGKYVARMDADDISLPERLEKQVDFLEKHTEYDVVGSARIVFDEDGEKGIRKGPKIPTKEYMLLDSPFGHPTIMMKKNVYDDLNGYTFSKATMRAEDLDLWFRFFSKGYKGYNLSDALLKYHESKNDLRKRNLKAALETSKVYFHGYGLIGIPWYKYIFGLKPVLSAIIPKNIMYKFQRSKLMKA